MVLFANEELLVNSNGNKIILTDKRLYMEDKMWGRAYKMRFFLEDISSIEILYKSYLILLLGAVIALIAIGFCLSENESEGAVLAGIAALILVAGYFLTRSHVVSITTKGGKSMDFKVSGMGEDKIEEFIQNVQRAQDKRRNNLK